MSQPVSDFKRQLQASTKGPTWGKAAKPTPPQTPLPPAVSVASSQPQTNGDAGPSSQANGRKRKHKSDIVWSQPSDTGTGTQRGTQLAFVLDYLKKSQNPIRIEDLAVYSNVPSLLSDPLLLESLEADENVQKNPQNGLYTWKRVYHSRTPEQLLNEIRLKGREGGLSVKALKEGFPEVVQHIDQLEQQGKVLVTRSAKDNTPKFVFWNEVTVEQGGKKVDPEFVEIWDRLVNPVEADLLKVLERSGLQATLSEDLPAAAPKKKSKKAKGPAKRIHKITNTHIAGVDLSKDYVKPTS